MINATHKSPFAFSFIHMAIIVFIVEIVRGAYLISFIPTYAVDQLHFSIAFVGIAVTAHYITDTVAKGVLGYLLDHFSSRMIVSIGIIISFIGLFSIKYVHYPWQLILSSAIYGVGISPIWIISLSQVRSKNRATQMGLLFTLWLVGLGAGPIIANFFIDISYNLIYWMMIVGWGLAWILSLSISNERVSTIEFTPFKQQMYMLWNRLKNMKPLLPGMIIQTMAASMLVPVLPTFATNHLGLTHTEYNYILIAGGGCAVLGLIPFGRLSDRLQNKKWFLVFGFGIFAFALYSITVSSTLFMAIVWAMVLGTSYSAVLPAWNALLSHQVPVTQQGSGWGIFSSIEGIGVMIGPIMGGWIADGVNETFTVLISATLLGGIALFYLLFPMHRVLKHQ